MRQMTLIMMSSHHTLQPKMPNLGYPLGVYADNNVAVKMRSLA